MLFSQGQVKDRVTCDSSKAAAMPAKPTREKDPKKVAAGRASAAARKAKQERLLEEHLLNELRTAKQSLWSDAEPVAVPVVNEQAHTQAHYVQRCDT